MATLQFKVGLVGRVVEAHVVLGEHGNIAESSAHHVIHSRAKVSPSDQLIAGQHPRVVRVLGACRRHHIVDSPRHDVQPTEATLARLMAEVTSHLFMQEHRVLADHHLPVMSMASKSLRVLFMQ
ncbi:MAG: hypothetical protein EBY79_04570 [Actinobacteria bacterium]|nr:hypothetical protein [Actinomycetota bacterium]